MLKALKNKNGFGLIGIIIAITVLMIMTASILPTFTARMNYKQAKYTVGVVRTIENAENAYMAKNNSFADLTTLASQGYLSSNFLQSVQGGMYPQPNWVNGMIANQAVSICIDNGSGCPNNPGVGNNGYFIGIYHIPANFQNYIEHELPGSGAAGPSDVSYVAPIPSSPPVLNAQNANYANSAGSANYANTAGYANSSGLPAWSQEESSLVGTFYNGTPTGGGNRINTTGNTLVVDVPVCTNGAVLSYTSAVIYQGEVLPLTAYLARGGSCYYSHSSGSVYVIGAYSG